MNGKSIVEGQRGEFVCEKIEIKTYLEGILAWEAFLWEAFLWVASCFWVASFL